MNQIDWNQLRAFLHAAETGSMSAAARRLGLSQPTLSRQVAAIEQGLGVALFERIGKSLKPTAAALALLEHARNMGAAAEELSLAATGHAQAIDGVVSISASDMVAAWLLPPVLRALNEEAPGLRIEIVTTNALSDLRRREADIAVRHVRPSEPELIGRLLREASAGFYAAQDWVHRHGHPRTAAEAAGHRFVGADRQGHYLGYLRAHGLPLSEPVFSCYAENSSTAWALVRQGLGIGAMMEEVAAGCPDVVRVLDEVPLVRFPIWLVTHRELHTARRIRLVFDRLAEALGAPPAPVGHQTGRPARRTA
ncbi:DNA-binding transcriptional LysR family regulator [Inhella inkyongensis]|uniref:DNA-binding transcriptional LysR family regulator n=1 Tax=Inhella inkyongensis TaxID=392593 RepID=A0A840SAG6_9BURK|nr:LysR family transcriptional regulator [Inhella inkyongensis]MBB5205389.1 DNA-binding transcriptional LysR family regulator [Inhella inkyongensis]